MNTPLAWKQLAPLATAVLLAGCTAGNYRVTNQNAVGPKVGNVVGVGLGAVVGNVAGAGVGMVEGSAAAVGPVFTPQPVHIVRHWHTETTADGRTIQVPKDYLVDEWGRVVKEVEPGRTR